MAEDNNLVIQKNTFQTCFYEIQLNYDNAKLTNFVSKLSFGKDDQNMSTFFQEQFEYSRECSLVNKIKKLLLSVKEDQDICKNEDFLEKILKYQNQAKELLHLSKKEQSYN